MKSGDQVMFKSEKTGDYVPGSIVETNDKLRKKGVWRVYDGTKTHKRHHAAKKKGDELVPVAFVVRNQDTTVVPTMPFMENHVTKQMLMDSLKQLAELPEVIGIALVNEVWVSTGKPGEPHVRPVDHPERKEAAMIRLEFRGSNVEVWKAEINDRELGEFKAVPFDDGLMTQRLFQEPVTQ